MVRMSGPKSLEIASQLFVSGRGSRIRLTPNRVHFGTIVDGGEVVDEVMLAGYFAPRSYTREDMVEITCHGGQTVCCRILTATLHLGARIADPGEFTKRAFLNGRIDLTQAEAVADIIASSSEATTKLALQQLQGGLRRKIELLREKLSACLAAIDASIDFQEEGIGSDSCTAVVSGLQTIAASLHALIAQSEVSHVARNGIRVAIVGLPNVGKSSLLNALINMDRAIVSPIPGTTRDTIEESIAVGGLLFRLIDTAGIRDVFDPLEIQGVSRSAMAMEEAQVILFVTEASRPLTDPEKAMLESLHPKPILVAMNKSDLVSGQADVSCTENRSSCLVSAKTRDGIGDLRKKLFASATCSQENHQEIEFLVNTRQEQLLRKAKQYTDSAQSGIGRVAEVELIAADLRSAYNSLGEIVGDTVSGEILDDVFSTFCIGK